jgi:hypothetical protein
MIIETLKQISNPYDYSTHRLEERDFIGREEYISRIRLILEEYLETAKLKNIIINGEKSIGKSSLLNRYKQILQDYNFIQYEVELSRDTLDPIDEFDFFKEFFDYLIEEYAPIEDSWLDAIQQEIWFDLTNSEFSHDSSLTERKIRFATQYADKKKGFDVKLSYKSLEKDFQNIMDALMSKNLEFSGLAILIDEFQELSQNLFIVDTLRQLSESENVIGLLIIGAGLPVIFNNSSFEKFNRTSVIINLNKLKEEEILDLICKPIEKKATISRYEAQRCFDYGFIIK